MKSNFFKEYFNFSKRERNGIITLCIVFFIIISTKIIIKNNYNESKTDFTNFEKEIDSFSINSQKNQFIDFFYFDPNTASEEELLKLGLSQKAVRNIVNFREKNGKFYKKEDLKKIYSVTEEEYLALENYIVIQSNRRKKSNYSKTEDYSKIEKKINYFKFDPNKASIEEFEKLGLKKWQALNIIKYRESGAYFKTKEDFSKVYGIKESDFKKLEAYIEINVDFSKFNNTYVKKDKSVIIEINTASSEDLQKLQGIGISFAKRIIDYKNKLGGFYNKEQLLEVYGFNEELYYLIIDQLIVDTNKIEKININKADYSKLIQHPYFGKEDVKVILNYKKFAGEIKNYEDLLKQKAITKDFFNKSKIYITTE